MSDHAARSRVLTFSAGQLALSSSHLAAQDHVARLYEDAARARLARAARAALRTTSSDGAAAPQQVASPASRAVRAVTRAFTRRPQHRALITRTPARSPELGLRDACVTC